MPVCLLYLLIFLWQEFLDEATANNSRHCVGIAFVPREGSDRPAEAAASAGFGCPSTEAVAALNASFFAGEDSPPILALDRTLHVAGRCEEGCHFLVQFHCEAELSCASLSLERSGGGSDDSGGGGGGGFAEQTARGLLLLAYGAGMDAKVAKQLTAGLQQALLDEGM